MSRSVIMIAMVMVMIVVFIMNMNRYPLYKLYSLSQTAREGIPPVSADIFGEVGDGGDGQSAREKGARLLGLLRLKEDPISTLAFLG
ncbi:hypothetical protein Pcinc_025399 [Petrolisthes cinctipes]|uniref:Uncharacterized protein n=1 Tax=Petrolisthes cinctipes TaxID=88211 RepID=A0AAE1KDU4_PETCI|nr:hypothetical protein Pcinc_025399 [Petrolisthes cinctipes]